MGMIKKRCPRCSKSRPQRHDGAWRRIRIDTDEFLPVEGAASEPYRLVCMFCVHNILKATLAPEEFAEFSARTLPNGSPRVKPKRGPPPFFKRLEYAVKSVSDRLHVKIIDYGGTACSSLFGAWSDLDIPPRTSAEKIASLLRARGLDAVKLNDAIVRVFEYRGTENTTLTSAADPASA